MPMLFDYVFVDPGAYTVMVAVWNCDWGSAVTDSVSVTVLPVSEERLIYLPMVRQQ